MNSNDDPTADRLGALRDPVAGDPVAALLRAAREEPIPSRHVRVHGHVHAAWRQQHAMGRQPALQRFLALAAAATFAVLGSAWLVTRIGRAPDANPAPRNIGTVSAVEGSVLRASSPLEPGRPLALGDALHAGDILRTGIGRLAFAVGENPVGVRLDRTTELLVTNSRTIELNRGALYIDSGWLAAGDNPGVPMIAVVTPLGTARDIGTRFSVRIELAALEVAVRDGAVEVEPAGGDTAERKQPPHRADSGIAITVPAAGPVTRRTITAHDPLWSWTAMVAPGFDLDGAKLADFLGWLSRESGWKVQFVDPELEQDAARWRMSGPRIEAMSHEAALDIAMRINDLAFHLDGGVLTIGGKPHPNAAGS